MTRCSVLYVLKAYPEISQSYIRTEIEAIAGDHDVSIVAGREGRVPYHDHRPYEVVDPSGLRDVVDRTQPDVLHTHYLTQLATVGPLADETGTPFTVRSHSFDTLSLRPPSRRRQLHELLHPRAPAHRKVAGLRSALRWTRHELCIGVLAFPFARPLLVEAGVPEEKIVDCFPAVDVRAFSNDEQNGDGVMNVGAASEKKRMGDFLALAGMVPTRPFRLYAVGYETPGVRAEIDRRRLPVAIEDPVPPGDMPAEYKRHQWLVYTADRVLATVGWPVAVAEAQASGVGVCMPRLRPDIAEYVGTGGILYDDVREVAEVVAADVPPGMREAGFAQARRSDIRTHKALLTRLWAAAVER